jgi:hypothetical protein
MNDRLSELSDEALGRRLAADLPRHPAPPALRARLAASGAPTRRTPAWLPAALAAGATALLLGLFFVPLLPRTPPVDPALRLTRAVVAEHTRAQLWGARRFDIIPTSMPWLSQETGIEFVRVFDGDDRLYLVSAEPVYLDGRRGLALHYRDAAGRSLTYVVLPAPGLAVPERRRMAVNGFRPALLEDEGHAIWLWKHGDLACFLVADVPSKTELDWFKDYFKRVRLRTEPVPAY